MWRNFYLINAHASQRCEPARPLSAWRRIMAGTALERELSTASRTRFAVACTEADDSAIRRLLRENPMAAHIAPHLRARAATIFAAADLAGGGRSNDRRVPRAAPGLHGALHAARMLGGWRVNACRLSRGAPARGAARGKLRNFAGWVSSFFDLAQGNDPAEFYFTSIGAENERARRLLEAAAGYAGATFPRRIGHLLIAVREDRARCDGRSCKCHRPTAGCLRAVRMLDEHGRRHQFAAAWTPENLLALEPTACHSIAFSSPSMVDKLSRAVHCGISGPSGRRHPRYSPRSLSSGAFLLNGSVKRLFGTPSVARVRVGAGPRFLRPVGVGAREPKSLFPDSSLRHFPIAAETGRIIASLTVSSDDGRLRLAGLRRRFSTRTGRSRCIAWIGPAVALRDSARARVHFLRS